MKLVEERLINISAEDAWLAIAKNYSASEKYTDDFVVHTDLLTPTVPRGLGARYRTRIKGGRQIDEEVVAWDEGRSVTLATVRIQNCALNHMTRTIGVIPVLAEQQCVIYVHVDLEQASFKHKVEAMIMARVMYSRILKRSLAAFDKMHSTRSIASVPNSKCAAALIKPGALAYRNLHAC